jgi:hypothetical protein
MLFAMGNLHCALSQLKLTPATMIETRGVADKAKRVERQILTFKARYHSEIYHVSLSLSPFPYVSLSASEETNPLF